MGPNLGSEMFSQTNPELLALSAIVHGARTEVSLEVVGKGAGTRFPYPRDVLMRSRRFTDRSLTLHYYCLAICSKQLPFHSIKD